MSTIAKVVCDHFRIPLPVVLSDSTHGEIAAFELITVRVTDSEGAEGLGYTYTVGAGGSAIHSLVERELAALLSGQDADRIEFLWQRMWWRLHYAGRGGLAVHAISAVDIALWDLKARRLGIPWWRLFGGHDPKVRAYAGGIDLYFTIDALLKQTEDNLKRGFRAIKMKVGRPSLKEDVERVAALRAYLDRAAGPETPLMVDANMRWSADQAVRAARAFAAHNVFWLEEPVVPDDIAGHVRVVKEGGLPVAAGENLHSLAEFEHLVGAGGITFPEPDVSNCGGVTVWLKVAHLAEANHLPVTSHGVHDLHVHLLAAVPNASLLEAHGFGLERFIEHPLALDDGYATAPDRPGHGVTLDFKALASLHAQK